MEGNLLSSSFPVNSLSKIFSQVLQSVNINFRNEFLENCYVFLFMFAPFSKHAKCFTDTVNHTCDERKKHQLRDIFLVYHRHQKKGYAISEQKQYFELVTELNNGLQTNEKIHRRQRKICNIFQEKNYDVALTASQTIPTYVLKKKIQEQICMNALA